MKTKSIILLAVSALTLFSFTFASVSMSGKEKKEAKPTYNEPIGGLASEGKY